MIRLFYTGCEQSVLQSLLDHLWTGDTARLPDLSGTALLLPTRNVGRQVREALALRANACGRALLSPAVLTPGALFRTIATGSPAPTRADQTVAVANAIGLTPPEVIQDAFGRPLGGGIEERLALARFFLDTRRELGEALFDFKQVAAHPDIGDRDRWRGLARIERSYRRLLEQQGYEDPDDQAARIAGNPSPHFPWQRMVVAATPDFPERIAHFLRCLAEHRPVEILVLAETSEADAFDDLGRPRTEWFASAPIDLPDESLRVCKDVDEANRRIAERIGQFPESRSACVCGVGLPSDGAALAFELTCREIPAYDPAGFSFGSTQAGRFFRHLTGVCFGEEVPDLGAWFRDPFVARWMETSCHETDRDAWIREADYWMEEILPNSIEDYFSVVTKQKTGSRIFAMTDALRRTAREAGNAFALFEHPNLRPLLAQVEEGEGVADFAESLSGIRRFAEALFPAGELAPLSKWAVEESMKFTVYPHRTDASIDVLGWLELLWDERPWLLIADVYDGAIPGALETHPLLPETIRKILRIPGRKNRDARDAYVLRTLFALRRDRGQIELYVPHRDLEGRPVSPSRLVYFTSREKLPSRVQLLSREPPLHPRAASAPPLRMEVSSGHPVDDWFENLQRIHVTSFAAWIRCPFTFYLERVAGLKTVDPDRLEMDPRVFGTGLHEVMRRLDGEPNDSLKWDDPMSVQAEAARLLDQWFRAQFGPRPGLLLQLQREGLSRRVEAATKLRAEARRQGWRPLHVEWNFREEGLLAIQEIPLSGQIDLVEERDGELRIIDYKTKDKPESPEEAHVVNFEKKRSFSPSSLLPIPVLPGFGWTNLQLPLYAAALQKKYPGTPIRIGYAQLPRAVSESRIVEWTGFHEEWAEAALAAAEDVVRFWAQKGFWPPSRKFPDSDPFRWSGPEGESSWLPGDLLDIRSLDAEGGPA